MIGKIVNTKTLSNTQLQKAQKRIQNEVKKKGYCFMKKIYANYCDDELWMIRENEWVEELQPVRESQFTLGNGYIGSRGVLEEIPRDAIPGTYIAGVYDALTSQVAELVNFPNAIYFKLTASGEKLDVSAMDIVKHQRMLNMKKGVLIRHTQYGNRKGHRFDYQSLRFISMKDKNIGVMQIAVTPLDSACDFDINTAIDTSVINSGTMTEGDKKHFKVCELGQTNNAGYLVLETLQKKYGVIQWGGFYYEIAGKKVYSKDSVLRLKVRKGEQVVFTKVFYTGHYSLGEDTDRAKIKKDTEKTFNRVFRKKIKTVIDEHIAEWDSLWKISDIVIKGTASIQQNVRFNIYHMLICGTCDDGASSIGARTLSGEGYRGHVFWDTEIFMFPFYLYTNPEAAPGKGRCPG